jgi:hypothetical protein
MNPVSCAYSDASAYGDQEAIEYCRNAKTVAAGVLCDESTVTSDACRTPSNAVVAFVRDDTGMADSRHTIFDMVKDLAMTILGVFACRP